MLRKLVLNSTVINTVIVLNCAVIFLLLFSGIPYTINKTLVWFDYLFNIFFLIEIIIKLSVYGHSYFKSVSNIIDVFLISAIIISFFVGDYQNVYGLYVLRLIRVIKCVKLFEIIPNYERIVKAVHIAWKTCSGLFVGILIILFVVAIILTIFYNDNPNFSNPLASLYSAFRLFSIEGWYEIPDEIASNSGIVKAFFTKTIFSFIVFFGGIVGMGFLTSVITDELASDNNDEVLERLDRLEKLIKEKR